MQLSVNDLGINQGAGGPQITIETLYLRRAIDPNFQPGDSNAHFQAHSGVMTLPVATTVDNTVLREAQGPMRRPEIDGGQINTSLMMTTNVIQNMNARSAEGTIGDRGADRLVNRGSLEHVAEMPDAKDARLLKENEFSADTQSVNEPIQQGFALHRDENILVGLGVVSAGYLAWVLDGGSLLAGALSATPMWMPFDPLAVLDFSDRAAKSGLPSLDADDGFGGEENLQSLLA